MKPLIRKSKGKEMQKRALLSVSDKNGLDAFAAGLAELGYELLSTGGTAKALATAGLAVTDVSEVTGFPEALDGRVKTLDPHIHAGILADRSKPDHMRFLEEMKIAPIDLVVVNLYPFRETVKKADAAYETVVENIDIGGPSMLRAAAKNHASVAVVTDPADYALILDELRTADGISQASRTYLAAKVFAHTAAYDALIADWFRSQTAQNDEPSLPMYPEELTLTYERVDTLRYGENSHQTAAFYKQAVLNEGSLPAAKQLHGKQLSYNNISDTDAALAMLKEFDEPTVVAVKHKNPCGIASRADIDEAWDLAYEADPVSIFGGIVAANRPITATMAEKMALIFLEVIIAPGFDAEAFDILSRKKNVRLLELPGIEKKFQVGTQSVVSVYDGLLVQDSDLDPFDPSTFELVTEPITDDSQLDDAVFGMKVAKHIKSNAICLVKDRQTVGIGPGQVNRITALEIAVKMAGDKANGSVLASDAFFPFDDCVKAAAEAGVSLIVQPGGSLRDEDSIKACNEAGIPMYFTGKRHFRH